MGKRDLLIAEGGVRRVVLELGLVFVAEDEATLADVEVGWDEVVVSQAEEDIVEFWVRGFAKYRDSG